MTDAVALVCEVTKYVPVGVEDQDIRFFPGQLAHERLHAVLADERHLNDSFVWHLGHRVNLGPLKVSSQELAKRRRRRRIGKVLARQVQSGCIRPRGYQQPMRPSRCADIENECVHNGLVNFLNPPAVEHGGEFGEDTFKF